MKLTKKKIFVMALALCLAAIISTGTFAWFNYTDTVENVFKVTDSDSDGTPDFSMELWETDESGAKTDHREYADLTPGDVRAKDPTVENTGNYDQYIRAYVTFTDASALQAACAKYNLSTDLRTWLNVDGSVWDAANINEDQNADTITYCYYLKRVLEKKDGNNTDQVQLFTEVTIPGKFQIEDLSGDATSLNIGIKAEAVQTANTGTYAAEAFQFVEWEAFTAYGA